MRVPAIEGAGGRNATIEIRAACGFDCDCGFDSAREADMDAGGAPGPGVEMVRRAGGTA